LVDVDAWSSDLRHDAWLRNAWPRSARRGRVPADEFCRQRRHRSSSERRQRAAIQGYARAGFEIADQDWFYDAAVRGADPIQGREGFAALLDRIEGNGVHTVIVEDASRFARDLVVQELGIALLAKRGVRLLTASGDDLTDSDDLGRKMMRQVAGAIMEYEKGRRVGKLRGARERKRKETGKKVGGRKSHAELWPEVVAEARRLRRAKGKPAA
jgi:DNA invertase Pin-like site-specific DNA recombinase